MPKNFPKIQSNPHCTYCYGTGYQYAKKTNDWFACNYCVREYGTDLNTFTGTNLVRNPSIYNVTAPAGMMMPPPTLPKIKAAPNCVICHGLGYEYKQTFWAPCDRCIRKFGNILVCRRCVGTGSQLKNGLPCKCLKHKLKPAKY